MYRVVIVEGDPMISLPNHTFVERNARFQVMQSFRDGRAALAWLEQNPVDLATLNVCMSLFTGLELFHAPQGRGIGIDAIMVTAADGTPAVDTLFKLGVVDYLVEPFTCEWLQQALDTSCHHRNVVARDTVEQSAPSRLPSPVLPAEHQSPKDLQKSTLELVHTCLWAAPPQDLPSETLSCQTGLSMVMARRYVSYLVEWGEAAGTVNYDTGDCPCCLYRCPGPPAWIPSPPTTRASIRNTHAIGLSQPRFSSPEQKGEIQMSEPGNH